MSSSGQSLATVRTSAAQRCIQKGGRKGSGRGCLRSPVSLRRVPRKACPWLSADFQPPGDSWCQARSVSSAVTQTCKGASARLLCIAVSAEAWGDPVAVPPLPCRLKALCGTEPSQPLPAPFCRSPASGLGPEIILGCLADWAPFFLSSVTNRMQMPASLLAHFGRKRAVGSFR